MKINKLFLFVGIFIIAGLCIYIFNIDENVICLSPRVSNTVFYEDEFYTINDDGVVLCNWVKR